MCSEKIIIEQSGFLSPFVKGAGALLISVSKSGADVAESTIALILLHVWKIPLDLVA